MFITARDMYTAQGFELTAEQRADLTARAAGFRAIVTANGGTAPTVVPMHIDVRDFAGALIGRLEYRF